MMQMRELIIGLMRQEIMKPRFDNAIENNHVELLTSSVFEQEEDNGDDVKLNETQLLRPEDNGQSDSNSNNKEDEDGNNDNEFV
jgi:hypothetical protein